MDEFCGEKSFEGKLGLHCPTDFSSIISNSSKNAIMIRIWLFEKDLLLALPQKSWNSCYDFNFLNSLYERMFAKIWGPIKRTSSFSRHFDAALKLAPNFVTGKNKAMASPLIPIWAQNTLIK